MSTVSTSSPAGRVALFATCLVDQFFPEVGLATLRVLERLGVRAEFPPGQTCCGQPFFNMGHREEARKTRNFAVADGIRAGLAEAGIEIEDTPNGPRWSGRA